VCCASWNSLETCCNCSAVQYSFIVHVHDLSSDEEDTAVEDTDRPDTLMAPTRLRIRRPDAISETDISAKLAP